MVSASEEASGSCEVTGRQAWRSPRGLSGSVIEDAPGVWVACERRVILDRSFQATKDVTIHWAVANACLYWTTAKRPT